MTCPAGCPPPPPDEIDDYFAMAVTVWAMATGRTPVDGQFNQTFVDPRDVFQVRNHTTT